MSLPRAEIADLISKCRQLNYQVSKLERKCLEQNIKIRDLECDMYEQKMNGQDTYQKSQQVDSVYNQLEIDESEISGKLQKLADINKQITDMLRG